MPNSSRFDFVDDGLVPNSKLPFLVYKRAIDVDMRAQVVVLDPGDEDVGGSCLVQLADDRGAQETSSPCDQDPAAIPEAGHSPIDVVVGPRCRVGVVAWLLIMR